MPRKEAIKPVFFCVLLIGRDHDTVTEIVSTQLSVCFVHASQHLYIYKIREDKKIHLSNPIQTVSNKTGNAEQYKIAKWFSSKRSTHGTHYVRVGQSIGMQMRETCKRQYRREIIIMIIMAGGVRQEHRPKAGKKTQKDPSQAVAAGKVLRLLTI